MPKKVDKFVFGITRQERGTYDISGITLDNIPEGYIDNFNDKAIERAKELKAKHKDKYSDQYYLERAKQYELRELIGRLLKIQEKKLLHHEIKDMQWAQYSYEEILQMEDDGIKIPEDVLKWAHAQQESDETNYVILTENIEDINNPIANASSSAYDLNGLKAKSMQDIAKIEKSEKETYKTLDEYNKKAEGAKQIQNQKENSYKENLNEIKDFTNEWKTLNEKQKSGVQLSKEEQNRLRNLGKLLNSSDGEFMKEIQADNIELDNFLDSLNSLSGKLEKNSQIALETTQNATQLSNYISNVPSSLPVTQSSLNNTGSTTDTLNGIKESEISTVAMEKGKDFEQFNNNLINDLNSNSNIKLAHFAVDYSKLITQTQNNIENTMSNDSEKSENQESNQNNNIIFSFGNSTIPAEATTDTIVSSPQVKKTNESLKKDSQKSLKDIIKLNSETRKVNDQHESFISEEEAFLNELETSRKQNALKTTSNQNEENNNIEEQNLITEIKDINNEDIKLLDNINKDIPIVKDIIDVNNTNIVTEQSAIIGAGTYADNTITTAIDQALIKAGIPMIQNTAQIYAQDVLTMQDIMRNNTGIDTIENAEISMPITNQEQNGIENMDENQIDNNIIEKPQETTENIENTNIEEKSNDNQTNTNIDVSENEPEVNLQGSITENKITLENNTQTNFEQEETPEDIEQNNQNENDTVANPLAADTLTAVNTALSATSELDKNKTPLENFTNDIENDVINSQNIINEVQTKTTNAIETHNNNLDEAANIKQQIKTAQDIVENTDNMNETKNAQNLSLSLNNQFQKVQNQDFAVSQDANTTVLNGLQQLSETENNTNELENGINNFNSLISNQSDASTKAATIGTKESLITNDTETYNDLDIAGTSANNQANTVSNSSSIIDESAITQSQNADNTLDNSIKTLGSINPIEETAENKIAQDQDNNIKEEEIAVEEIIVDNAVIAASATTNSSIIKTTETDDKVDKRLTRFNEESIIESRKRMKKVLAVSASAKNRR